MYFSQISTALGDVTSLSIACPYVADPLALYQQLCADQPHNMLLESADIDSKDGLKSLLLVDAAVKIVCQGHQVELTALTENGAPVLALVAQHFQSQPMVQCTQHPSRLELHFAEHQTVTDEATRLKQSNAFSALRAVLSQIQQQANHPYALFLGGVFAYDMIANFESLPQVADGTNSCPDYCFYIAETLVIIDHTKRSVELIGNVFSGEHAYANCFAIGKRLDTISQVIASQPQFANHAPPIDANVTVSVSDQDFKQQVVQLKEHIAAGDIFQVVPSRSFSLACPAPMAAYAQLKKQNPSPYMFYLQAEDFVLFGASPESALKYQASDRQVEVYPIAGTRRRGFYADGRINHDLDSRIELGLRNDQKERAEHLMLVDLARNDIARIAMPGSRYVKELLKVDRYAYVMHLVSRVVGTLKADLDALHAYQACMNMGTLVGAPKVKAAQLIRNTEQQRRGSYGGAVGYLTGQGDMDTCIVIRSAFVQAGIAHVQAGAGVVHDSDPQSEADETRAKAQAVLSAIINAHNQPATGRG